MNRNEDDALHLLSTDHETIESLLEELVATTSREVRERATLLERLGNEIRAHASIEEDLFYSALQEAARRIEHELVLAEALEEHRAIEELVLTDLERTDPASEAFAGRAKVLHELVASHARGEERRLFDAARELLSAEDLRELGRRLRLFKESLLEGVPH